MTKKEEEDALNVYWDHNYSRWLSVALNHSGGEAGKAQFLVSQLRFSSLHNISQCPPDSKVREQWLRGVLVDLTKFLETLEYAYTTRRTELDTEALRLTAGDLKAAATLPQQAYTHVIVRLGTYPSDKTGDVMGLMSEIMHRLVHKHMLDRYHEEHANTIYGQAVYITKNHEQAEELVHETYLRLANFFMDVTKDHPHNIGTIGSYFYTSMRHAHISNQIRQRRRGQRLPQEPLDDSHDITYSEDEPESLFRDSESRHEIATLLAKLGNKQYTETMELYILQDLNYHEIARVRNEAYNTIKGRIRRASAQLFQLCPPKLLSSLLENHPMLFKKMEHIISQHGIDDPPEVAEERNLERFMMSMYILQGLECPVIAKELCENEHAVRACLDRCLPKLFKSLMNS